MQKLAYLNYPYEESLKYFGNFFKVARLMLLETLQHDEVLPDNCQLKTFEICSVKLLLRLLAPFLFKWSLLLFRLDDLLWSFCTDQWEKKFLLHISFKGWWTSLPFLFNSGFLFSLDVGGTSASVMTCVMFCVVFLLLIEESLCWCCQYYHAVFFTEVAWITDEVWTTDEPVVVAREREISSWCFFLNSFFLMCILLYLSYLTDFLK